MLKMVANNAYTATKSLVNSWSANNGIEKNIYLALWSYISQLYTATNFSVISRKFVAA